eukprot:scaffold2319_cov105-Isochrysis_galbana.AAC.2
MTILDFRGSGRGTSSRFFTSASSLIAGAAAGARWLVFSRKAEGAEAEGELWDPRRLCPLGGACETESMRPLGAVRARADKAHDRHDRKCLEGSLNFKYDKGTHDQTPAQHRGIINQGNPAVGRVMVE